ncbi:lactam utilization protein LamB [Pollutimonas nitritireducens]|uniref:5-oxoprolinase subunit A n=1 Tax=Pollutimonas nitritireducens TaxID=2045209 RepID=A0A2N4UIK8_9BURK|nr:5-oxoprolinase subunit PxpA [Pollutimonas nitritireducens]PLC54864.1 lactam utilization protein LamB [Pollutimonas nitritireducens]
MTLSIDLNCDMGESFGAWNMGQDDEILPFVTSANIACGFHAGDPGVMRKTVAAALKHGVALGAHPGLPDLAGFGRRSMDISPDNAYDMVVVQLGSMAGVAASQGSRLHHVKAHGALYNMAARQPELAKAIAQAVYDVDRSLVFYALASSVQAGIAQDVGLNVAQEVFADRSYQSDGSLTPRRQPGAMIVDVEVSIRQVLRMITEGKVSSMQGVDVAVQADTLCIHGDQPGAVMFARAIRQALHDNNILVKTVQQLDSRPESQLQH